VVKGLDIALLREKQSGKVVRVEKGAPVSDMNLAEVYPDRVVLRAGDDSETLMLSVATGPTASAATPVSAPATAPRPAALAPPGTPPPTPVAAPRSTASALQQLPSDANLSPAAQEARREALRRLVTW